MKLTSKALKQIIKEELNNVLKEISPKQAKKAARLMKRRYKDQEEEKKMRASGLFGGDTGTAKPEDDPFSGDTKTGKPPSPGDPGFNPFSGVGETVKPDADEEAENLAKLQKRSNALAQVEKVLSSLVQKIK